MTEEELFEIMKKEYPEGDPAFCLNKEHWRFSTGDEKLTYMLTLVPQKWDIRKFTSEVGWQEVYNDYLRWKEELDV